MMIRATRYALCLAAVALPLVVRAELSPEIQLDAHAVISTNVDATDDTTFAVSDLSDTSVLLGFRQKLYGRYRGQFVVGLQFPEAGSDLGPVFYHHAFIKVEDEANILKIGRSRVMSSLIEFPTLRDDDALHFTDTLNPFSAGNDSEDSQYGEVIELSRGFGQRVRLNLPDASFAFASSIIF